MTFIKSEVFVTKFMIYEEGMLTEIYFETKFYVEIFYQGDGYPIIHDLNLDCYFCICAFLFFYLFMFAWSQTFLNTFLSLKSHSNLQIWK